MNTYDVELRYEKPPDNDRTPSIYVKTCENICDIEYTDGVVALFKQNDDTPVDVKEPSPQVIIPIDNLVMIEKIN